MNVYRRLKLPLVVLLPVLVATACAGPEIPPPEQTPAAEPAAAAEQRPRPASRASKANDELARLPPIPMLAPERALQKGLSGQASPGLEQLIGLTADDIGKMLGRPDFKRHDPPAEIWQYRRDGCLLDVFLYLADGGDGAYRVSHVEARSHSVVQVSGGECLAEALIR